MIVGSGLRFPATRCLKMGIQGLLPALKPIMTPIHVKELAGSYVAVDTYSWLHKGAFSCSRELCQGLPTRRHIDYCMYRVNLLRHHGVKPILVFDGGVLPMKAEQEAKRARVRKENLDRAVEHEARGNHAAAYECYQKAVDISPSIAFELIQVLRQENVEYIVAPYEADAQMAFLSIQKHVEAVITEDSDLIPFGCLRIIFKMDRFGQGVEFQYAELARHKELNFTNFTKQMVLEMCILSGCDYLQSLQGMGIKKAHGLIRRFKSYGKIIKHLRYGGVSVPPLYEEAFRKAILTFHHQLVYDPVLEDIVHLMEPPSNLDCELDFSGPPIPQNLGRAIATGEIDPITKQPFQEESSVFNGVSERKCKTNQFQGGNQKRVLELPVQKNVLTNYFCPTSIEAKRQFKAPRVIPGLQEQKEDFLSTNEENGSHSLRTCDFEGKLQESILNLKGSMSGTPVCMLALDRGFSSDDIQNNNKSGRPVFPGNGHWEHSEQDGILGRKDHCVDTLEFLHTDESDLTFEATDSGKFKPLVSSRKVIGSKFTTDVQTEKAKRIMKRDVIVRSSYFCPKTSDNSDMECAKPESFPDGGNGCDVTLDLGKAQNTNTGKHSFEHASDNSYLTSIQEPQEEFGKFSYRKRNKIADAITTGKRKHVPSFNSDLLGSGIQQENFACKLSHLDEYSDIAEQSMERFVSAISSFRYTAGGARASGLRPPLKSAATVRSVGASNETSILETDFSQFAYDINKSKSQPSNRLKSHQRARTNMKNKHLNFSEQGML